MIFEESDAAGIRYTSRFDISEECWAAFEATEVGFSEPEPIDQADPELASAAKTLRVALPG